MLAVQARLLGVVHGEHGSLGQGGDPVGEVGVPDLLRALARSRRGLDHLGVPPGGLRIGDPTGAVALDAEQALDSRRPEALCYLELEERHDRHLVLAESVVGRRLRHADRLADHLEQLERDPGPLADLPERLAAEGREPLVGRRVEEGQTQGTALHGGGDAFERDPGILERLGHQDATHVTRREAIALLGGEDAEIHQSNEVGRLDPGSLGSVLAWVPGHVVNLQRLRSRSPALRLPSERSRANRTSDAPPA